MRFLSQCLRTKLCMAKRWVMTPFVAWLVTAVLSLLAEHCRADGGGPSLAERVIWAVNSGGESHTDMHGIHFRKDPLEGKLGKGELTWTVVLGWRFIWMVTLYRCEWRCRVKRSFPDICISRIYSCMVLTSASVQNRKSQHVQLMLHPQHGLWRK